MYQQKFKVKLNSLVNHENLPLKVGNHTLDRAFGQQIIVVRENNL